MPTGASFIGKTFGRLKVLNDGPLAVIGIKRKRLFYTSICKCKCGEIVTVVNRDLERGDTKSCGCWNIDLNRALKTKHGRARTKEHYIWVAMHQRCNNPKNKGYKNYGGRGIKVCKRWNKFENFFADKGECPKGLTLERINNDGDYEPSNCCWDTRKVQAGNKRSSFVLTVHGKTACLAELCDTFGKKYGPTWRKLRKLGWSVERAFA